MLANHPEDKIWDEHLNGSVKYIGRLDDFPYSDHSEVDHQHYTLRDKIKRLRKAGRSFRSWDRTTR